MQFHSTLGMLIITSLSPLHFLSSLTFFLFCKNDIENATGKMILHPIILCKLYANDLLTSPSGIRISVCTSTSMTLTVVYMVNSFSLVKDSTVIRITVIRKRD